MSDERSLEDAVKATAAAAAEPEPATIRRKRVSGKLLAAACLLALLGLGVTIIHFVLPSPLMFTLFMSVGQGSFGLAMLLYLVVIFSDLRRRKVL